MLKTKKGAFDNLSASAIGVGVFIIVVVVVSLVLAQMQSSDILVVNSTAYNTTTQGLAAMGLFGSWASIIVITLIGVVIIGLIYGLFRGTGGRS